MLRTLLRLCTFYAVFPRRLCLAALCTLVAVAMGLATPWLLKMALDYGLAQQRPQVFYLAGGLLLAFTLLRGVATYGQHYLNAYMAQRLAYRLRHRLYEHLQRLSFAYHDRAQTGELMSRATADIETVRLFFHFGLPTILSLLLTCTGTVIALAWLDWRLAALVLAGGPLFFGVVAYIGHLLRPLQLQVQESTADLTVVLQESLAGIRIVKAFGREGNRYALFTRLAAALYDAYLRVARLQAMNFPLLTLILALAVSLVLYLGGRRVIGGTMSLGTLVAAVSYLAQLAQPLRRLSWLTGMATRCQAGGERLFEILDVAPDIQDHPRARPLHVVEGAVCFDRVDFHYQDGIPVLHDIRFAAAPGETVALLGSTGSGKTTMAQLIPRFYDVTAGRLTIDGVDVRDVQLASLRRQIGIVMQESVLFSATIRDNIAYGRNDLGLDDIIKAASAAHAHDFIMRLADGYDTWVGERGVTLSGGQRQRIALARVLVRDPRILILDDATSSVDMETEWLIQQALAALMVGRTSFVIAQRLRTLKQADTILVLDQGRIVQRGTHEELLCQPGLYRRIYDVQLRDQEEAFVGHRNGAQAAVCVRGEADDKQPGYPA